MMLNLKIKEIMKEKSLTQKMMLEKMDLRQSRLSMILSGKELKNISLRTALEFCKGLDVDIYELIEGTEYDIEGTEYDEENTIL